MDKVIYIMIKKLTSKLQQIHMSSKIHLRNQIGFTLIQVLVVLGLVAGISLYMMRLVDQSNKVQTSIEFKDDFSELVRDVTRFASSKDLCSCGLKNVELKKSGLKINDTELELELYNQDCSEVVRKIASVGHKPTNKIEVTDVKLKHVVRLGDSNYLTGQLHLKAKRNGDGYGRVDNEKNISIGLDASSITTNKIVLKGCTEKFNKSIPLNNMAGTIQGNQVNQLRPFYHYLVTIYGLTPNKGNGSAWLEPVRVLDCHDNVLSETQGETINWPDGQTPQTASFYVQAPEDGCIRGKIDTDYAHTKTMSYMVIGSPDSFDSYGGFDNVVHQISGDQISGLEAGESYMVSVYGVSNNRGSGNAVMQPHSILECSTNTVLSQTSSELINWPDGNIPVYVQQLITAPSSGCIKGLIDGDRPAKNISALKVIQ